MKLWLRRFEIGERVDRSVRPRLPFGLWSKMIDGLPIRTVNDLGYRIHAALSRGKGDG